MADFTVEQLEQMEQSIDQERKGIICLLYTSRIKLMTSPRNKIRDLPPFFNTFKLA